MDKSTKQPVKRKRLPWEAPSAKKVGTIGEVVRMGGGKLSAMTGDTGEPRKVPATG
jgi:hypothetical protein